VSLHRICSGGVTKPYYEPGSFMAALIHYCAIDLADGLAEPRVASFVVCGRCYRTGAG
jgi:hypothetical protein